MKYFWDTLGWFWAKRAFFLTTILSALLFFAWFFPFGDMSDAVTAAVARGTGNQVYVQFQTLNLNMLPTPAVSATEVSVETPALPTIEAKWMKFSPSWLSLIFNAWTLSKASSGDPEATKAIGTRIGFNVAAEGLLGADVDMSMRPGAKTESGVERSRVSLEVEKLNLSDFQKWMELPFKLSGHANLETDIQFAPNFQEQPEGDVVVRISKFNMPSTTLMIPVDEMSSMPVNVPTLTLENLVLRGRFTAGSFVIEQGQFGNQQDPISGRIKGQLGLRFQPVGQTVVPVIGSYNLTVELNVLKRVEKDIGIAFILFDQAKRPTSTGSHYLFRALGQGPGALPSITRIATF